MTTTTTLGDVLRRVGNAALDLYSALAGTRGEFESEYGYVDSRKDLVFFDDIADAVEDFSYALDPIKGNRLAQLLKQALSAKEDLLREHGISTRNAFDNIVFTSEWRTLDSLVDWLEAQEEFLRRQFPYRSARRILSVFKEEEEDMGRVGEDLSSYPDPGAVEALAVGLDWILYPSDKYVDTTDSVAPHLVTEVFNAPIRVS